MSSGHALHAALAGLPHGPPFRFVSRLSVLEPGVHSEGVWLIAGNEDFFGGHFPGEPIVPGVLLGEALAQVAGLILGEGGGRGSGGVGRSADRSIRLARIDVKFPSAVRPPAEVSLAATLASSMGPLRLFEVVAQVGPLIAATGQVVLAVEEREAT